jgi:hypothetical protein
MAEAELMQPMWLKRQRPERKPSDVLAAMKKV